MQAQKGAFSHSQILQLQVLRITVMPFLRQRSTLRFNIAFYQRSLNANSKIQITPLCNKGPALIIITSPCRCGLSASPEAAQQT